MQALSVVVDEKIAGVLDQLEALRQNTLVTSEIQELVLQTATSVNQKLAAQANKLQEDLSSAVKRIFDIENADIEGRLGEIA